EGGCAGQGRGGAELIHPPAPRQRREADALRSLAAVLRARAAVELVAAGSPKPSLEVVGDLDGLAGSDRADELGRDLPAADEDGRMAVVGSRPAAVLKLVLDPEAPAAVA